jgi:hypothetical protein
MIYYLVKIDAAFGLFKTKQQAEDCIKQTKESNPKYACLSFTVEEVSSEGKDINKAFWFDPNYKEKE